MTPPSLDRFATWAEIGAQPALWADWGARLDIAGLRAWIAACGVGEVWLCGAGSSAYVGEMVAAALEGAGALRLRAVATTDLVARPRAHLRGAPRLVVNFGRSGNSAETVGTLDALDALAPHWPRLNITCNGASALARRTGGAGRALVLPEGTHDAGFAMTSSFTTMYLTALAILDPDLGAQEGAGRLTALGRQAADLLPAFAAAAARTPPPGRAVFLGSGALTAAAREAALKAMELTAGAVPCLWDSTLGFRHGPKSFVAPGTRIEILAAADPHARAYDADLAEELVAQFPQADVTLATVPGPWGDGWAAALHVVRAQVLAVHWSAALGLGVDDPFAGRGTLTRVVAGVRLHPVGAAA
jgi:tagatose-6-phosphate ketose/aldose isomerase